MFRPHMFCAHTANLPFPPFSHYLPLALALSALVFQVMSGFYTLLEMTSEQKVKQNGYPLGVSDVYLVY